MAAECPQIEANKEKCNCTYPCSKKGQCCECLHSHLAMQQLPACCFPNDVEATYDRSFKKFIQTWQDRL